MLNNMKAFSVFTAHFLVVLFLGVLMQPVLAQDNNFGASSFRNSPGLGDGQVAPPGTFSGGGGGGIKNPLSSGGSETVTDVLKRIINWMLGLVGFLALIALIIGGAQMIMDFGNEDRVQKAKVTITWAVIGLAVVILSYAIINIVTSNILGAG